MQELRLMLTITDRQQSARFVDVYQEDGVPIIMRVLGRGTATREMLDYFGLEATEKAVLFSVASADKVKKIRKDTVRRLMIDVPGNGILVTAPIGSVGGSCVLKALTDDQETEQGEEAVKRDCEFELIVIILNEGHTDMVMDAARSAKARGGTVVHAKGTGSEQAKKFFGVSIAEEKEMIFIVSRVQDKNAIMKAVMTEAGLKTKAQSLVFSVPLDSVAGLRMVEDQLEEV